jgi:class 3 adenylate cyclase
MVDWAGGAGYEVQPGESARVMATILFTDIVGSTARARKAGDAAGKRTLAMHDDVVRTVLVRFGGREVETAGDSFLIVFDGAERAIRCGLDLVEALAAIDIPIRVGIHSGEVALSPEHVHGVAVHVAARILTKARAAEVLVSGTTCDLAEGSAGLAFHPRGRHRLKRSGARARPVCRGIRRLDRVDIGVLEDRRDDGFPVGSIDPMPGSLKCQQACPWNLLG